MRIAQMDDDAVGPDAGAPRRRGGRWEARRVAGASLAGEDGAAAAAAAGEPSASSAMTVGGSSGSSTTAAQQPGRRCRRLLFVGNSLTYQPKELGGLPGAVARIAAAAVGEDWHCESVTEGGADLLDLWEDFETRLLRGNGEVWDVIVLQVGQGSLEEESRFAMVEVLSHRYGPLLRERQPNCQVVLYQTWADPGQLPGEAALLHQAVEVYRASLLAAGGPGEVLIARVGEAFRLVREGTQLGVPVDGGRWYPALFKDDSGHPSAFAGLLIAAVVVLVSVGVDEVCSHLPRPLGQILSAILPASWRTASTGYAGEVELGQRGWLDGKRTLPAGLTHDADEDLGALAKYPPGMRTEKLALGPGACDALAAAATLASRTDAPGASDHSAQAHATRSDAAAALALAPAPALRRWRAR